MNLEKNWIFWLFVEIICFIIFGLFLFVFSSSIIFTVGVFLVLGLYKKIIIHKPLPSLIYRLERISYKGGVIEKRIHSSWCNELLPEYIVFNTIDNQHIKVYITVFSDVKKCLLNVEDTGTLYCRKDKKHLYFEEFEKHELTSQGD